MKKNFKKIQVLLKVRNIEKNVVLRRKDIEKMRCIIGVEKIENVEDYSSSLEVFKKKVKGP